MPSNNLITVDLCAVAYSLSMQMILAYQLVFRVPFLVRLTVKFVTRPEISNIATITLATIINKLTSSAQYRELYMQTRLPAAALSSLFRSSIKAVACILQYLTLSEEYQPTEIVETEPILEISQLQLENLDTLQEILSSQKTIATESFRIMNAAWDESLLRSYTYTSYHSPYQPDTGKEAGHEEVQLSADTATRPDLKILLYLTHHTEVNTNHSPQVIQLPQDLVQTPTVSAPQ